MDTSHGPSLSARLVHVVSLSLADGHPSPHTLSCPWREARLPGSAARLHRAARRAGPGRAGPEGGVGRGLGGRGREEGGAGEEGGWS